MEIWEIFDKSFAPYKKRNIAIYGIGENTKLIVEHMPQYRIVGLLDGVQKSGTVYGIPLLNEGALSKDKVDMVIIIARSSNVGIILKRIAHICMKQGIDVFDIQGTNLLKQNDTDFEPKVSSPDKKALLRQVRTTDIVSFNLFDTLIMRKLLFPTDVYELMKRYDNNLPEDFPENRMLCERKLMQGNRGPTINSIYHELQKLYGWTHEQKAHYAELEYTTDCKCMVLRKDMYAIYQECCTLGKKLYIITDMYYTKEQIKEILKKFHVSQYEDILVSCENRTSKSEHLFDIYLRKEPQGKKLHIGDEEEADILPARKRGINTFPIMSGRRMLECSSYAKLELHADSILERVIVGCFIAKMFNSPFDLKDGRGIVRDKKDYGYLFVGALVLVFCLWMMECVEKEGIDNILFSARDGYIIKKVYEDLKTNCQACKALPDVTYLYASRAAYVSMSICDEEDLRFAYGLAYDGTPEEMLRERFRLSEEEIEEYQASQYEDDWEYIVQHLKKIRNRASHSRNNFFKYLSENNIEINQRTAYFDFVSSGTCQRCLQNVMGKPLKGYYFSYIDSKYSQAALDVEELFHNQFGCVNDSFLCDHYLFLENIFTSHEPTLKEFDDDGKVLFLKENRTAQQLDELAEIHEGILVFPRDVVEILNSHLEGHLKKEIADEMFSYVLKKNTRYLVDMEINGELVDAFCRRTLDSNAILGE